MVNPWQWMLFKVAGGTILCQSRVISAAEFEIANLTELKLVDPRLPIFEKASAEIADVMTKRLMSDHEKKRAEMRIRAEADQDAAAALEEAKMKPPVFAPQADQVGAFLSEPIIMRADAIVWRAPASEDVAKMCEEFWAAKKIGESAK